MITKIKTWFANLLIGDYLGSFVRTGIAILAGFLLKENIATAEQAAALSAILIALWKPLVLYAVAQAASLINKKAPADE